MGHHGTSWDIMYQLSCFIMTGPDVLRLRLIDLLVLVLLVLVGDPSIVDSDDSDWAFGAPLEAENSMDGLVGSNKGLLGTDLEVPKLASEIQRSGGDPLDVLLFFLTFLLLLQLLLLRRPNTAPNFLLCRFGEVRKFIFVANLSGRVSLWVGDGVYDTINNDAFTEFLTASRKTNSEIRRAQCPI